MAWLRSTACIPVVTMTIESDGVRIDWDAIPNAQEYVIEHERPDTLGQTLVVFGTSVVLLGEGRFRILPVFGSGAEGSWSDWFALSERITVEPITTDQPITVTQQDRFFLLTWAPVPNASGYELQANTIGGELIVVPDPRMTLAVGSWAGKAIRVRPFFRTTALVGNWSDWHVLPNDAPHSAQLYLYTVTVYVNRAELPTFLYCAHFVSAEDWARLESFISKDPPIVQSIVFAGPFGVNDGHNPHPLTGAVAWLSAYSNLPQRRYAIGPDAQLFAGASVADLEAYVTRWQGTIYDARPAA